MNVLWDFRFMSLGYRDRGVGKLVFAMAQSLIDSASALSFFVWGDRTRAPAAMDKWPVTWVPYRQGNWKTDLFSMPRILSRYRIDLLHHWVALGPLRNVSLGVYYNVATVGQVIDLGVELWDGVPFLASTRQSLYWRMQCLLIRKIDRIVCPLDSTLGSVTGRFPFLRGRSSTIRMPLPLPPAIPCVKRLPYIVTLGGSPHKNVASVVKAYAALKSKLPGYRLIILGDFAAGEEHVAELPDGVVREPMERYQFYLQHAQVLATCSFHEGLGIPALEAMQQGCPLLLSDISQFRETARDAAAFARPDDIEGIASCIGDLVSRNDYWSARSYAGALQYHQKSMDCATDWLSLYNDAIRARRGN